MPFIILALLVTVSGDKVSNLLEFALTFIKTKKEEEFMFDNIWRLLGDKWVALIEFVYVNMLLPCQILSFVEIISYN